MRVVGRNPVGARVRTLQRGSEREPGPWHEIVGVVTDLLECSPPIGVGRRTSIAQPPRRSSILSWSPCASRGTPRRLRPASPPLRGRSMRACTSGISSPSTTSSHRSTHGWWAAASSSAAFCSWRWSSPRPVCTRSWPSPWSVAPARSASVSHSAPTPGTCSRSVFARAGRQLGGGIIAGNSLILLLAWRADSLTADLLVSSVITSVIMAAVGVLACAAPARRALRIQPTEALRQG